MPFNIMCFFPDLLSPLSHGGPTSVLWVLLETGGFSSSVLHSWESQTLTVLPFLHQRGLHPLIQLRAVLPWGRDSTGKVLFSVSSVSKHGFFFVCFFFFTSGVLEQPTLRLDFYKVSLICGFLPKSALSRFSFTVAQRSWNRFTGSCWVCNPY